MTDSTQSNDIYGILINADTLCVLLFIDAAGKWSLPQLHIDGERIYVANVEPARVGMTSLLGTELIILRAVRTDFDKSRGHTELIYVLENQDPTWNKPAAAQWISRQALASLSLTRPNQLEIIINELRAIENLDVPLLRPPWAKPGWFKTAASWIRQQLGQQGYTITGAVEQTRVWGISCLLRVQTDQGMIYFKVSNTLPLFGHEPMVLAALAERYPDMVPAPIAIEPAQRWMLMHDFGSDLRSTVVPERWETAIQRFGQFQVRTIDHIDALLAVGCLDRRLPILSNQIDPLLADEAVLASITPAEAETLRAIGPRLKMMCLELSQFSVPSGLNHGDLHSGNITGQTLLFYDWTDACIAHPFLDLVTLMYDANRFVPDTWGSMLAIYLNLWTGYESTEQLRTMWKLAEPLGALHQAVSYQHILASQEPTSRQELSMGLPLWIRHLLVSTKRNFPSD